MTQSDVISRLVPAGVVEWRSMRVKHVVKSTLASEAAALSAAQDRNEFNRVLFACCSRTCRASWTCGSAAQRSPWELG